MSVHNTEMVGVNAKQERHKNESRVHLKKNPSCFQNVQEYFYEFCEQTSMHGFNLLGERGRIIPERIYWIIVIIAATYLAVVLVYKAYIDWLNSPVIVTFATSQLGVWDIPFPALTICPQIKSIRNRFNYTEIYFKRENGEEVTANQTKDYEYMSLVCPHSWDFSLNEIQGNITDEKAIEFLRKVAPSFKDFVLYGSWLGETYEDNDLTELFSPILTSEGMCYTFNNLHRTEIFTDAATSYGEDYYTAPCEQSEWTLEFGYSEDSEIFSSCPKRTLSAGIKGGLDLILLTLNLNIDYICGEGLLQGYKVVVHHPAEIPRLELGYFFVPLDQSVIAAIKPNMMVTSENLEHYNAIDRQCYFSTEKSLKFFKIYNQQNCVVECLTNYTLENCGCVEFHMPRENSTPICSSAASDCIENAKTNFQTNEEFQQENSELEFKNCNCLPSCTSLDFEFEYSQADWKWQEFAKIQSQIRSWEFKDPELLIKNAHLSRMVVFFKNMQFMISERNELKGQLELWSDFGGLLGLFLGFSFISLFDILYYLTLRVTCNVRLFGRHYWSGSEKFLEAKQKKDEIELKMM